MESLLPQLVVESPYRTTDVKKADFFLPRVRTLVGPLRCGAAVPRRTIAHAHMCGHVALPCTLPLCHHVAH